MRCGRRPLRWRPKRSWGVRPANAKRARSLRKIRRNAVNEPVIVQGAAPYAATVERLRVAIADAGNTVFAVIDQAAAAQTAGLTLRPTTLIVFGNPKGGTPLMDAHPLAALALPLKILVWDDGGTKIAYAQMAATLAAYGVAADDPRVRAMDGALASLAQAGAQPPLA